MKLWTLTYIIYKSFLQKKTFKLKLQNLNLFNIQLEN